jgi:hypothetical protein
LKNSYCVKITPAAQSAITEATQNPLRFRKGVRALHQPQNSDPNRSL